MATDDERRRVAERLRRLNAPSLIAMMSILDVSGRDMCTRLADLIDPDCWEDRYEGLRTVRPVDRDALLALADSMCVRRSWLSATDAERGKEIARRIREALGVVEK